MSEDNDAFLAEYVRMCKVSYKAAQEFRREHNRKVLKELMESPDVDYGELNEITEGDVYVSAVHHGDITGVSVCLTGPKWVDEIDSNGNERRRS